jgi:hypothetical protein
MLYQEISTDSWKSMSVHTIEFTDNDINSIQSFVDGTVSIRKSKKEIYIQFKRYMKNNIGSYIFKLDDYWFVVYHQNKFYKCDDINGLEDLIRKVGKTFWWKLL